MFKSLSNLAALVLMLGLLTGCESKFSRQNYEMIRVGMDDRLDVREILGDPASEMSDVWLYDDLDDHHAAQIFFDESGRVLNKEWMGANAGEWGDEGLWADEPREGGVPERRQRTGRQDP